MLEINGITTPMLRISIKLVRMVNDIAKIIDIFFLLFTNLNNFTNSKNE